MYRFHFHFLILITIPILLVSCGTTKNQSTPTPPLYKVQFTTTKGVFVVEVEKKWSPQAADRFYQLVQTNYYSGGLFYRVIPDFVAQFGGVNKELKDQWEKEKIEDEPVLMGNERGTLSFARFGKRSRGTELYLNLKDNHRLDTLTYEGLTGFPAFGKVTEGMAVVDSLYGGYGEKSAKGVDMMYRSKKAYLRDYPKLDGIIKIEIVE